METGGGLGDGDEGMGVGWGGRESFFAQPEVCTPKSLDPDMNRSCYDEETMTLCDSAARKFTSMKAQTDSTLSHFT